MSRWLVGFVVLGACASRPAPVASTTPAPSSPSTVATVTQVRADAPGDPLAVAAAAYERGAAANTAWKFDEATTDLDLALSIYQTRIPETDERFLDTLIELGRATRGASDWDRSEKVLRRWLTIVQAKGDRYEEARALNQLGLTVDQGGDPRGGMKLFEAALAIDDELGLPDDDSEKNAHLHNLGLVLSDLNEHKRAAKLLERVLVVDRAADPVSVSTANTMHNLALTYRDSGDYAKAKPLFESAIRILTAKVGANHPRLVPSLNGLAGTLLLLREYDEAELLYGQVLAFPNLNPESRIIALADLAVVETETQRYDEAIVHLDESMALLEKRYVAAGGHAETIRTLIKRAEAHVALHNYTLALRDTDAAIAMSMKINAGDRANIAKTIDDAADVWASVPTEAKRTKALQARARAVRAGK